MSHIVKHSQLDEWEEKHCDNCGHSKSVHYDTPRDIFYGNGGYMYTAEGCLSIFESGDSGREGKRMLKGNNPYPRCGCMKFI